MSKSFYTSVQVLGSKILYRGVQDGHRKRYKIDYAPTLYVPSKDPTQFTTIHDEYVADIKLESIREARDFVKRYEDTVNFKIYGNQRYEYAFIADNHPEEVDWDRSLINVCNIDIEVGSESGFPEPDSANEPIIAITYFSRNSFSVFGVGDFSNNRSDVRYIRCADETDLIRRFLDAWCQDYPDIVTGWNIKFFDIPYLVHRMNKIIGETETKRFSPWNVVSKKSNFINNKEQTTYTVLGVGVLDYMELYKRFAPNGKSQESYKLDYICHEELGERKLSYEEYGNLHTLYKEDYQKFIEYNIRDVELIEKLDDKLKLIDLALTLAYDSKSNYEDVNSQVRMWDNIIFNYLKKQNKIIPPIERHSKDAAYVGAYVKDPIVGLHNWVASFDLNSLYPHLIMQYNISPEMIIRKEDYTDEHKVILSGGRLGQAHFVSVDNLLHKKADTSSLKLLHCTVTPNRQFFKTDKQGFLPKIMEDMYNDRTVYKKKAIEAKKQIEKESDSSKRKELDKLISRYHNLQLAKKVSLNSAYGALGSEYFRFYDIDQATAVTTAGQLSIRWIENKLNEYLNKLLKTENKDYVIASDTDSIYLSLDELVRRTILEGKPNAETTEIISYLDKVCENKIQPFIDKSYIELAGYTNAFAQKMIMKREALADKGIWTAKKRYILNVWDNEGVRYAKPKVKVMGLEMIKSSTPSACREKLWEALDIMLTQNEENMIEFIENFRKQFRELPEGDIAFPRGVNGIESYTDNRTLFKTDNNFKSFAKGTPIHVRGSIVYNSSIKKNKLTKKYPLIKEGEKIKFIYLKEPNTLQSNIISFPQVIPNEFDLKKYIDYDTQFEKSFVEPLRIILDCIGWKTERIEKTSSLESFFGE